MTSRVGTILVGLLTVGVVGGTAAMLVDFDHRVAQTTAEAEEAPPLPTLTPDVSPSPSSSPTHSTGPRPVSLWIGDGYTAGAGAKRSHTGEACVAAKDLGWRCELDAERGTGFLSDGSSFDPTYASLGDRIDDLPEQAPDVVVVDAGRNDLGVYSTPAIVAAMDDYVGRLRAAYPHATLVQVVPWRLAQDAPDEEMTRAVTDLMDEYDGYVVDPVAEGWAGAGRTDKPDLLVEPGVADQAGHDLIGAKLAAAIRDLDLPVPTEPATTG